MKYFILAGEKSGDLHGSNLVKQIILIDAKAEIIGWGGDQMKSEGVEIIVHHQELAIMGILGVLKNLFRLKKLFNLFSNQIREFKPDTIIFIDFGGFNLKAAKIAKLGGFHTQFYIAPKVWAWNKSRINSIKKWVDQLYVIFPFELDLFKEKGISTHYIGNPLKDAIDTFVPNPEFRYVNKDYIALLAGSRRQEINAGLPIFEELVQTWPEKKFIIAGVSEFKDLYENSSIKVVYDQTYDLLSCSSVAVVTSGTATLETALLNIPQIVVYKTDWLFYILAKMVIKIKYISLVNIILNKKAVPELIQSEFNSKNIQAWLLKLLDKTSFEYKNQKADYENLNKLIGPSGASKLAAEKIVLYAKNQSK
ncbi:MAG: lipid-A-disaccharide synthase [Cytophagales bacterium]|nr:lipid-A-disaccharide synthase [Cytophagales bacterium]